MVSQRTDKCIHLEELLKCQTDLIIKHLARHKWFNEIPDEADGVADFIEKYGWLMRELYCGYACPDRDSCNLGEKVTI